MAVVGHVAEEAAAEVVRNHAELAAPLLIKVRIELLRVVRLVQELGLLTEFLLEF